MLNSQTELESLALRLVPIAQITTAETVLPRTAQMNGDMTATGKITLRLEGTYKGKIILEEGSCIHIAADAIVESEKVEADYIVVEGSVKGNLEARCALELLPTARVAGRVAYQGGIDVHAGARISGQIEGPESD